MNHWAATAERERAWLARRFNIDELPRDVRRPVPAWQRRAREHALRRIARAFRIPCSILAPRLATPPLKRNARKYGR